MISIAAPTEESINDSLNRWSGLEKYVLQEECCDLLFRELRPENTNLVDVLLKVSALNDFYSTNIYDTHAVAKHIARLGIDKSLSDGDLSLVNRIALVKVGTTTRNFYSFATKYCSHHRPDTFPIYDQYVEKVLIHFKKRDNFAGFTKTQLKDYPTFVAVIDAFRQHYKLDSFTRKQIDVYLWLIGKQHFNAYGT